MSLDSIQTLIEMLEFRATETPRRVAATIAGSQLTFGELWQGINDFAACLSKLSIGSGDRVIVAMPNSADFFVAFYGSQRMGGIPVPIFPGSGPERILAMARLSKAGAVVVPRGTPPKLLGQLQELAGPRLPILTPDRWVEAAAGAAFPEVQSDDTAFIQYTSGSTGNPKGVQLTHANLLTNMRQMIAGMEITSKEIFVSWLPVYHDMGLIINTMIPFYLGAELHLLPSSLKDVRRWLATIQDKQATFTAAPDFAYRLCLRHIERPADYDLSSLRVALNAAEPVRQATIEGFHAAFGLQNVMVAAYGLAEATVGVSMWPPQTANRISPQGHVSVGRPFPAIEIKIVRDNEAVGPGQIGEIAIQSPANSRGYFNNPEATRQLYWRKDTILSGDLGFVDEDGYLYVVGRQKNVIIQTGHSIHAEEVEEVVNGLSDVRYSAAVGIDRGRIEGEQVTIFAEIREEATRQAALEEATLSIVRAFDERFGFRPGRVFLLRPKTIPLTPNGKLQHGRLKELHLRGVLRANGKILFPDY